MMVTERGGASWGVMVRNWSSGVMARWPLRTRKRGISDFVPRACEKASGDEEESDKGLSLGLED